MNNTIWYTAYITDKTGNKFFKNKCGASALNGVLKELETHLKFIKENHKHYSKIGVNPETAEIVKFQD